MDDLKKEFEDLKLMLDFPKLYLSNYFTNLRNEVDFLFVDKQEKKFKTIWSKMTRKIDEFEKDCSSRLSDDCFDGHLKIQFKSILEKIDVEITNLDPIDSYSKFRADDFKELIIKEKTQLGRVIFSNKSIMLIDKNCPIKELKNRVLDARLIILRDVHICKSAIYNCAIRADIEYENLAFEGKLTRELVSILILKETIRNYYNFIIDLSLNLDSIVMVNFPFNVFSVIEEDTLEDLKKVESIFIPNSFLNFIHSKAFYGFDKLKSLDLSNNGIFYLDSYAFKDMYSLEFLNLSNNFMQYFEFSILRNLFNLKVLDLSGIGIKYIPEHSFSHLTQLEELYLVDNELDAVEQNMFCGLLNLKILNLSKNRIKEIRENNFVELACLEKLILFKNEIETFDINGINGLDQLRLIILVGNPIIDDLKNRKVLFDKLKEKYPDFEI